MNLLQDAEVESVIIFANRRDQVRRLHEKLRKAGVHCGMLSWRGDPG
jgi:ATP-dependent RNA helicase RhlB